MRLWLLLALISTPALAQGGVSYPPAAIDPATVVTPAQAATIASNAASAAIAADTTHATTSALSAVQATIPTPMLAAPPAEVVGGAAGTAGTYRTGTAVQPRITRSVPFTTGSGGTAAPTWTDMGAVPYVFPVPNVASGATQAPSCFPVTGTITSTGATIKCFTTQTVTVSILGATVAPITTAAAGVTGQVLAIPAS